MTSIGEENSVMQMDDCADGCADDLGGMEG